MVLVCFIFFKKVSGIFGFDFLYNNVSRLFYFFCSDLEKLKKLCRSMKRLSEKMSDRLTKLKNVTNNFIASTYTTQPYLYTDSDIQKKPTPSMFNFF